MLGVFERLINSAKSSKELAPCNACASTGYWDKVQRPYSTEPEHTLTCSVCGGRGWCHIELNDIGE